MLKGHKWKVLLLVSQLMGCLCCIGGGGGGDGFGDTSVRTPLPAELTTGEWRDPQQLSRRTTVLDIYDVDAKEWFSVDESDRRAGIGYRFYPDGRYVRASYVTIKNGGCVSRVWNYQQGGVALSGSAESGSTLTFYPAVHRQKYEGGCNHASDMDQDGPLDEQVYAVGIQAEGGETFLYLQNNSENRKFVNQ